MQKKEVVRSKGKPDNAELVSNTALRDDWRVVMASHPQTGFYYAAGIKLDR